MSDPTLNGLILLPRLRVENANAISGPLTWGFPAPSAFTGFIHALERRLDGEARLDGVGIVCHHFEPQVYRPAGKYTRRFRLARHPMGPDGKPPGTVEEGRVHLEVSLLIGVLDYLDDEDGAELAQRIQHEALGMRLAGGSILPPRGSATRYAPQHIELSGTLEGDEQAFRRLRHRLLPGFALVGRHRLLREHLEQLRREHPETTALDALLDLTRINVAPAGEDPARADATLWRAARSRPGWLVPLPAGYGAISPTYPPGSVQNARDETTPFRFVESLYSLGEWLSPHRVSHPRELLWYHRADPDAGTYLCTQLEATA